MTLYDLLTNWNKWFVFLPTVIGIVTLIVKLQSLIISLTKYFALKDLKAGIYYGWWIDPMNKKINCETLTVRKTLFGLRIVPVYKHASYHNYRLTLKPLRVNKMVSRGTWHNVKSAIYRGSAMFHYNVDTQQFAGRWIGPRENNIINGDRWILQYSGDEARPYMEYLRHRRLYRFAEQIFPKKSLVENIIQKHVDFKATSCTIENVSLLLQQDSFIPTLGKISIPLVRYAASVIKSTDSVLDLGTGTGFYPIYLAKNVGCKAKGIDISDSTVGLAVTNAIRNEVKHLTNFATCPPKKLFEKIASKERFDIIVANLPFSRKENVYKSKKSPHYHSFAGSRDLLEQFILGSQYHLNPNGKVIFCYGESGYMDFLQSLVNVSSWDRLTIIDTIHCDDDNFHICQLEFKEQVKQLYAELDGPLGKPSIKQARANK
jgi:methylase of polypeptide subunit release factors